jgi:hypothetical protein
LPSASDDETQILSLPIRLRRTGREITMRIDGTDPFATAKPDARLIKLLIRARRFNATLLDSDGVPFAALAKQQGVSPSYFTRLVRLSYLAAGGLISYSANLGDLLRRSVVYVDKILKGAEPADLPVQQPTTFELVVNLNTAKALGLTIPPSILAREVIE